MRTPADRKPALSSLMSKTLRMKEDPGKTSTPGPGFYNIPPTLGPPPISIDKKPRHFNLYLTSTSKRDSLFLRDPNRSPFKDPTFKESPSPATYMRGDDRRHNISRRLTLKQ
jgi:hypothetical protein